MSEDAAPYFVDKPQDHCAICCSPLPVLSHGARLACPKFHGRWQGFYVSTVGPPAEGFDRTSIIGNTSGRNFYIYGVRT